MIPWLTENLITSSHLYKNQMEKIGSWAKKKKKTYRPNWYKTPLFQSGFQDIVYLK